MTTFKAYILDAATKRTWYVANLKGHGGKDWGYSFSAQDAIPLSMHWRRRLLSDMRTLGRTINFY